MSNDLPINKLVILGVGLMGGSLARALRQAGKVREIVGYGRGRDELEQACQLGVIDRYDLDLASAVTGADIIVLAIPVGAIADTAVQLKTCLNPNSVLTDVGSTKVSVIDAVRQGFGRLPENFVPGHPIAGTEKKGVAASFATLFNDRRVILTPLPETRAEAVQRVRTMWQWTGAKVVTMEPVHHDEVLAATSHLPHVLAYTLVDALSRLSDSKEIFQYAAGGFRDFTRIASSDPQMWHDICLANREQIVKIMELFREDLARVQEAIATGDSQTVLRIFTDAQHARDHYCKHL